MTTAPITLIIKALSFSALFGSALSHGGVYIIEDIEVSYWSKGKLYGYSTSFGFCDPQSIVERFKLMADVVNWEFLREDCRTLLPESAASTGLDLAVMRMAKSISFVQNCIIVTKKNKEDVIFENRTYRFARQL